MAKQEDLPLIESKNSKFFYGHIIVLAGFVIMMLAFGLNYTFGIFFEPLLAEFGWTRAVTSAAYSLMHLVAGFLGIFAGRLSDRFGPRVVGAACGFFFGLGFLLMSQVNALWQLYLFYGLTIAAGLGSCWPSLMPTVTRWFVARRGLMTGTVAAGSSFGIVVIPPLASRLISIYDWRSAYIIIGIIALVIIILAAQFLKRDPTQIGQLPYGQDKVKQGSPASQAEGFSFRESIHTRQFWMVCIIYFSFGVCLHTVMVHIAIHATGLGISAANAANILAIIGGAGIVGRVAVGGASDRFGVKQSLIFAFTLLMAVFLCLQILKELWAFYLFAAVFGFACGGIIAVEVVVIAELFGLTSLGIILGSIMFAYTTGGAVGPVFAGYIFDITNSYQISFWFCAALSLASIIIAVFLKPITGVGERNDLGRSR